MPSAGGTGAVPDASGVPTGLTAVTTAAPAGSTDSSECVAGSGPGCGLGHDRDRRGGEPLPGRDEAGRPPVAGPGGQRVLEGVGPVLQLEPRPVRHRTAGLADPDRRRPAGAGPGQREVSAPVRSTAKPGSPRLSSATECAASPGPASGVAPVWTVASARSATSSATAPASGHDQHRQRPYAAQVGAGLPDLGQRPVRRDPDPGSPVRSELAVELRAVPGRGGGQDGGGERVAVRTADGDAGVGQVGVDRERAVPAAGVQRVVEVTPARTSATTRSRTPPGSRGR